MERDLKLKKRIGYLFLLLFAVFMIAGYYFIGVPMLKAFNSENTFVRESSNALIFVLMIAIQVIVAIIPGEPLELYAGFAFGAIKGAILSSIGILIGSLIVFVFVKKFGKKAVFAVFPKLNTKFIEHYENEKRFLFVSFILMMIPGTPKDILTYIAGLTPMDIKTWAVLSFFARIPSILTSTLVGASVFEKNYVLAAVVFIITGVLSGIGLYIFKRIENRIVPKTKK